MRYELASNQTKDPPQQDETTPLVKTKVPRSKEKDIITKMLSKKINKDFKQHNIKCQSLKVSYGPIIGIYNKDTWRNWAWVTDKTEAYNDVYDSRINIDNLTLAINQTKTPQNLGVFEIIDTNLLKFTKELCPTSYLVDSVTNNYNDDGECTNQKSVDIKYYSFNDYDLNINKNSLTVAATASSPMCSSSYTNLNCQHL